MKASEIRETISVQELNEKLVRPQEPSFSTCASSTRSTSSRTPCDLSAVKKDIARVKTVMREKELASSASNFEREDN